MVTLNFEAYSYYNACNEKPIGCKTYRSNTHMVIIVSRFVCTKCGVVHESK